MTVLSVLRTCEVHPLLSWFQNCIFEDITWIIWHIMFLCSACSSCLAITCIRMIFIFNKKLQTSSTRRCSQTVTHPSTNRALCQLTSEFRWDRVNTSQCGRWRIPGVEYSRGEFLKIMLTGIAYTYYFMTLQHISVRQIEKTHSICLLRFSMPWLVLLITIAKLVGAGLRGCALRMRPQSFELQRPIRMVLWWFRNVSLAGTAAFIFQSRCHCSKVQAYPFPCCTMHFPTTDQITVELNSCSMNVYVCMRIEGVLHVHSIYALELWTVPVWHSEFWCNTNTILTGPELPLYLSRTFQDVVYNLVDPASSHMLVLRTKPCMSQYKLTYCETANGSLKQL